MGRKMNSEEKEELRKHLEGLAKIGEVKGKGIDKYLAQDLEVPLCLECNRELLQWKDEDIAIETDKGLTCADCDVKKTKKSFKTADTVYKKTLSKEEIENIDEDSDDMEFVTKEIPVKQVNEKVIEQAEKIADKVDDLQVLKELSKKHGIKIEITALEDKE